MKEIKLKSQPKWMVRMFILVGAVLGGIFAFVSHPIGGTNAQSVDCPEGKFLATGDVCITNEKDIVIQATATEANQTLRINKYFSNAYTVDRGDGTTGNLTSDTTHTYSTAGAYEIILSLSGTASRWTFQSIFTPLVPKAGTTVTGVQITYMPSLLEGFGDSETNLGNNFFSAFNYKGGITSLPEGSFDMSNITSVGNYFFNAFNQNGSLTNLPEGSFDISSITDVRDGFFSEFNQNGSLTNLPEGSFDISSITDVGQNFFYSFNAGGSLTNLPEGSFDTSHITVAGYDFFAYFNQNGSLISLPEGSFDTSNISIASGFFFAYFNQNGSLISLPEGSFDTSNITVAGSSFFAYFNQNGSLTSLPEGSFDISNISIAGGYFFAYFNKYGSLTSLPEGSFNTSNITRIDSNFFAYFNQNGSLTSLPEGSFDTSSITIAGTAFFYYFNQNGSLISLPEGSFDTSNITVARDYFFAYFNQNGSLTGLPEGSFDTSNITIAGGYFFAYFNQNGSLTGLPEGSFKLSSGIKIANDSFFSSFNRGGALASLPEGSFDTSNITKVGKYFFDSFNQNGSLTSLPEGSFDTSNITIAGGYFFAIFNCDGALKNLPEGSFDISNITTEGGCFFCFFNSGGALTNLPEGSFKFSSRLNTANFSFFSDFNKGGALISLPDGSFDTSHITSAERSSFFGYFNQSGALTSLPEGSFDLRHIIRAGNSFLAYFNHNGSLTSLPESFKLNSAAYNKSNSYKNAFNSLYTLNRNVSDLVSGVTVVNGDKNTFSDNQPGRCGVHPNWLVTPEDACSIIYDTNGGGADIITKKYTSGTTGVEAGDGVAVPIRDGLFFDGWYTDPEGGELVENVIFPSMDGDTLYAHRTCGDGYIQSGDSCVPGCRFGDQILIDGESVMAYFTNTVPFGQNCISETRVCTNGILSGSYTYGSCSVQTPSNCTFQGQTIEHNGSLPVYSLAYEMCPNTCTTGTVTCYDGTLGGDTGYTSLSCSSASVSCDASFTLTSTSANGTYSSCTPYTANGNSCSAGTTVYKLNSCNSGFHTEDGESCISDSSTAQCSTGSTPANATPIITNVPITWSGNAWSIPANCVWICDEHYHTGANGNTCDIDTFTVTFEDPSGENADIVWTGEYSSETSGNVDFPSWTRNGYTLSWSRDIPDVVPAENIVIAAIWTKKQSGGNGGGGGGGSSLKKDNCPDGDYSDSYYDGTCGKKPITQNDEKDSSAEPQHDKTGHNSAKNEVVYDTLTFNPHYSDEMNKAYQYSYHYGITTKNNIRDAAVNQQLTRIAMAKMLSQYAINVLGIKPDATRNNEFGDVSDKLDTEYADGVTLAYQLGIMGINMPNNKFRPYGYVTRAEFATALSRLLYKTSDGEYEKTSKYYVPHINKLAYEGILTNTDPYMKELRGYVMLMLMRSAK